MHIRALTRTLTAATSTDGNRDHKGLAPGSEAPWPRWRVLLIRLWSGLLTAWVLVMAHGVVSVASAAPDEQFMYVTSTVWKLLSLGGVAWVLWTGGRSVAAYWLIAVGQLVWAVSGVLAPQPDANDLLLSLVNLLILYGPLVALRPQRRQLLRPGMQPSPALLALSLVAGVPLALQAVRVADELSGSELGFDMTGLYLVLAAVGVLAAMRPHGGQGLAYLVAAGAGGTGLTAVLLPSDDASPGRAAGILLLAWAVAMALASRSRGTTDRAPSRPS